VTAFVVEGLRLRRGERVVLDGFDLRLEPGEVVAVQGPSGSGKTSLLRALAALDPIDSGRVTLDGRAAGWGLPEARWDQPWSRLSGGEQQRALLALALCRPCDVLLLDEPTSALDPAAAAAVEASLAGRAAVWVTHDAEQALRTCRRVLTLEARP
jgi:ABC-type cobalamin/Fe3+-siderophores transport system ATPase subunit